MEIPKCHLKSTFFFPHPFSDESIHQNTVFSIPIGYSGYCKLLGLRGTGLAAKKEPEQVGWELDLSSVSHKGAFNNLLLKGYSPDCVGQ